MIVDLECFLWGMRSNYVQLGLLVQSTVICMIAPESTVSRFTSMYSSKPSLLTFVTFAELGIGWSSSCLGKMQAVHIWGEFIGRPTTRPSSLSSLYERLSTLESLHRAPSLSSLVFEASQITFGLLPGTHILLPPPESENRLLSASATARIGGDEHPTKSRGHSSPDYRIIHIRLIHHVSRIFFLITTTKTTPSHLTHSHGEINVFRGGHRATRT